VPTLGLVMFRETGKLLFGVAHAAQRCPHHRANAVAIFAREVDVRVVQRLPRGNDRELSEAI